MKKKIKVLHIIASPTIGGAEKLLINLFKHYDRDRFDMILGCYYVIGKENIFWDSVKNIDGSIDRINIKHSFDLSQVFQINTIIKKYRPDIIHTHGYKTNILGFLLSKVRNIPIVATVHGWLHSDIKKTQYLYRINVLILKYFNSIIAVSSQIKSGLLKLNINQKRIVVLRNIPATGDLVKDDDYTKNHIKKNFSKIIGFVGRLEPVKGGEQFIYAAFEALKCDNTLGFVLVGDGTQRKYLKDLSLELDIDNNVFFFGFHNDPTGIFKHFDVYLLPSLDEGIPLTVLEAMALGIPVIATKVGGVPEIVKDHVNGMLVPPDDPKSLADALIYVLRSESLMNDWRKAGLKMIFEEYNFHIWMKKLTNIYLSNLDN